MLLFIKNIVLCNIGILVRVYKEDIKVNKIILIIREVN